MKKDKNYFKSDYLVHPNIKHAFFTRNGGVSTGLLSSLNFAMNAHNKSIELANNLKKNKQVIADFFKVKHDMIKISHQVHSTDVKILNNPDEDVSVVKADALVTNKTNIVLAIKTADCCPVLFADVKNNVIAAAHAGWRGAFKGILENTIDKMIGLGAEVKNIHAVIGPSIDQKTYEVDNEFYQAFLDSSYDNKKFFNDSKTSKHYMFNLKDYVIHRLHNKNVRRVENLNLNTYDDEKNFFSCRRAFHKKEPYFGCQLSAIMLK